MAGHGHVIPNEDGSKARCGGPMICDQCAKELAAQKDRIVSAGWVELQQEELLEMLQDFATQKGRNEVARAMLNLVNASTTGQIEASEILSALKPFIKKADQIKREDAEKRRAKTR